MGLSTEIFDNFYTFLDLFIIWSNGIKAEPPQKTNKQTKQQKQKQSVKGVWGDTVIANDTSKNLCNQTDR